MNRSNYSSIALAAAVTLLGGCQKPVSKTRPEANRPSQDPADTRAAGEPAPGENVRIGDSQPAPGSSPSTSPTSQPPVLDRKQIGATRAKAIGKFFVTLQIGDHHLSDARIQKIDNSGVQLRLENGVATFAWEDVPELYRRDWGYDPATEIKIVSDAEGNRIRLLKSNTLEEQERIDALRTQVAIIDTRITRSESVIEEARSFHRRLTEAFEGTGTVEARQRSQFLYRRIRESRHCSRCAPPTVASGSIASPEAVRDRVLQSLDNQIAQCEGEIAADRNRRDQLAAAMKGP